MIYVLMIIIGFILICFGFAGIATISPSPTNGLRNPEMAYRHGIQIGQQIIMEKMMPTAEAKEKARQELIKLVKEADEEKLGLDSFPLDEYRESKDAK